MRLWWIVATESFRFVYEFFHSHPLDLFCAKTRGRGKGETASPDTVYLVEVLEMPFVQERPTWLLPGDGQPARLPPLEAARFMTWLYPKLGKLGLRYGDSGIFVRASVYHEIGGFKPIPLFEDLDFVCRLKRCGRMVHVPIALVTSSRRFEGRSFALTFARWSIMQALYWLGVSPRVLNQLYSPLRTTKT